jgi:predicted acylesterase/phospholipase RssA
VLLVVIACALSACAHRATPKLATYDLNSGYRFERIPKTTAAVPVRNSDEVFVVLALSGGGTRAAALSVGVMNQLKAVTFRLNPTTGLPCAAGETGCEATPRSLLDEVDVISSVSGGSFTAAGYALYGPEILNRNSTFQKNFLYYPLQRDLFAQAVFYPQNWQYLGARTEIAAKLYDKRVFGKATFKRLEARPRPFIILNATDSTTGSRFEFNQDQFDLLCSDLSPVPIARGVTASSAFPGLLNSMAVDSHNKTDGKNKGCGYNGPGSGGEDNWVAQALKDRTLNPTRYRTAQQLMAYRDPNRTTLHMLDGGLADNIGLRSVIRSVQSTDRAAAENPDGTEALGGWSLKSMANKGLLKTIVVITVNARVKRDSKADTHVGGPSTFGVLGSASGIPMGNFSSDTLQLVQATLKDQAASFKDVKVFAFEVAFEDLPDNPDQTESERHFFQNLGTNFELQPFEVDCLIDRGARLLRDSQSALPPPFESFVDFVQKDLKGELGNAGGPHPPKCTDSVGKKETGIRSHYIDVGVQYGKSFAQSGDIEDDSGPGLALRITRPSGLSAIVDYGTNSFDVTATVPGTSTGLGKVSQRTLLGGIAYTHRLAQLEATAGIALGYGWGSFDVSDAARDDLGRQGIFGIHSDATDSLVISPRVSLWQNLSNRFAAGVTGSYLHSNPTVRLRSGDFTREQAIDTSTIKVSAGVAFKVF